LNLRLCHRTDFAPRFRLWHQIKPVLWDATGAHDLAQEIPANDYFSIPLLGVNDHGQILAELLKTNAQGVLENHWGYLK